MLEDLDTGPLVELDSQTVPVIDHIGGEIDITYHLEDAVITDLLTVDIRNDDGDIVKQRRYHNPWLVQSDRWLDTTQLYVDTAYVDHSADITLYHDPEANRLPPAREQLAAHTVETRVKNDYASIRYQTDIELDHQDLLRVRRVDGTVYNDAGETVDRWSERYRFPIGTPPAYYTREVTPESESPHDTYEGFDVEITLYLDDTVRIEDSNNPHPTPRCKVYYAEVGPKILQTADGESVDVFEIPPLYCDAATVDLYTSEPEWTDDRTYRIDGDDLTETYTLRHNGDYVGHTAVIRYFEGVHGRLRQAADIAGSFEGRTSGAERD